MDPGIRLREVVGEDMCGDRSEGEVARLKTWMKNLRSRMMEPFILKWIKIALKNQPV